MFSVFNPSKCTHLEQWAADTAAPGEQSGVQCLAQGSHLSRGQFLPELRFEPTTSGYKSNARSIRATTAPDLVCLVLNRRMLLFSLDMLIHEALRDSGNLLFSSHNQFG